MSCRQLSYHRRRRFIAIHGVISGFMPVSVFVFVVLSLACHTLRSQKKAPMKPEAQAAHVRKDPNLPSDRAAQSVSNSTRFAAGSQRKVLFQVTPHSKLPRVTLFSPRNILVASFI